MVGCGKKMRKEFSKGVIVFCGDYNSKDNYIHLCKECRDKKDANALADDKYTLELKKLHKGCGKELLLERKCGEDADLLLCGECGDKIEELKKNANVLEAVE